MMMMMMKMFVVLWVVVVVVVEFATIFAAVAREYKYGRSSF